MATKGVLSRKDIVFNMEIKEIIAYLRANDIRLVITPEAQENLILVEDLLNNSTKGWKKIYAKYIDRTSRTVVIKDKKNILRKEITRLLQLIYMDIPKAALTVSDCSALNIKLSKTRRKYIDVVDYSPNGHIEQVGHLITTIRIKDPEHQDSSAMPYRHHANINVGFKLTPDGPIIWDADKFYEVHDKLYNIIFDIKDVNKTAFYRTRYLNHRGKAGVWSNIFSSIVI